jgi:acetolactate synthase-1/2/3 large subunit
MAEGPTQTPADEPVIGERPGARPRTAARLLVECLVAEGCEYVFSVPGEETMDILEALADEPRVRHITTRHEQGAAFMADVYGRLSGRAAVAMATLGPGATNLVTGVADAHLDHAPMVVLTGQVGSDRLHKEAHQRIDIVELLRPITKWNQRVARVDAIPEIVRKAFRIAQLEKPGPTHIELPEDRARMSPESGDRTQPLGPRPTYFPQATEEAIAHAARLIESADRPIILAGNGVLRRRASPALRRLAHALGIPVAVTFMAKGAIDDRDELSLMAIGLQARDHALSGFDRADLVVCVGYDPVEYAPESWNPRRDPHIIAIDTQPAEVDASYQPEVELVGDISSSLQRLLGAIDGGRIAREHTHEHLAWRDALLGELDAHATSTAWPIKPQKALIDLRSALAGPDIVVCDVGAHKVWTARLFQAFEPDTVIISNGLAAMGIGVPGAIAAAMVASKSRVVALTGDGGFLMNSQELETAQRIGVRMTVVVWRDDGYGLIDWKQGDEFGRPFGVAFGNPDLVKYAESFGIAAFRPASAADLLPTLRRALDVDGVSLVDVPIDYAENARLSARLGRVTGEA